MSESLSGRGRAGKNWRLPALLLLVGMAALWWVYLNVPPGFPEQWAGRERLPDQSVRVSALYRHAVGLPLVVLPIPLYRLTHGLLFAALWPLYALAVHRLRDTRAGAGYWMLTGSLLLTALAMPPLLSTDAFYYGITGQIVSEFRANPHLVPPLRFPESRLLPYNFWTDFPSPYGPLWTSVAAAVVAPVGDSPLLVSAAFKFLSAASVAASTVLVYSIARRLASERAVQATALWAWNPLVLLESAGTGHNDALVALLLLGALRLLLAGKGTGAYTLAVVSALVKLTAAPVAGLLALGLLNRGRLRHRARRAGALGLLLLLLIMAAYAPYWDGLRTLQGLVGQPMGSVHGPVSGLVWSIVQLFATTETAEGAGRVASLLSVAVLGLWLLGAALRVWRAGARLEPRGEGLLWGVVLILAPVVFVRAYPWYIVPGLALMAAVWPHGGRTTTALYLLGCLWFVVQYGY